MGGITPRICAGHGVPCPYGEKARALRAFEGGADDFFGAREIFLADEDSVARFLNGFERQFMMVSDLIRWNICVAQGREHEAEKNGIIAAPRELRSGLPCIGF